MVAKQNILYVIKQAAVEAVKTAIMAVSEAENPVNGTRSVQVICRMAGSVLK